MVIFGTSALSISTILTVFLSGIALGGYIGGYLTTRVKNEMRFCAVALVLLGLYCVGSVYLFDLVRYPMLNVAASTESALVLNLWKFFFCFLILIFPTTIIGAMFPFVTKLYSRAKGGLGRDVALIYFLDTLGAAAGALLCGFYLVPVVGLWMTTIVSGSVYVLLGLLLYIKAHGEPSGQPTRIDRVAKPTLAVLKDHEALKGRGLVLAALFLTGFSALALEVTWSRHFHLILGTSIYAFAMVIAAFLLGMSIGSFVMRGFMDRIKDQKTAFAFISVLIAGVSFLVVQTSDLFELFYFTGYHATGNFYVFQAMVFAFTFVVLLIPTSLMGANFPLAVSIFSNAGRRNDNSGKRGKDAGVVFSVNTAGAIVGAFVAGFVFMPKMGVEGTALVASALYIFVGIAFFLSAGLRSLRPLRSAVFASLGLLFLISSYISYGDTSQHVSVYYNGVRFKSIEEYRKSKEKIEVLYSKQGLYGLVSVHVDPYLNALVLLNNGKVDASTTHQDMQTQELLGHLPMFLNGDAKAVLNIGLGSGITTGAVLSHPGVELVDSVEIDPLVEEVARNYFSPYNNNALTDPRVRVFNEDGRHHLYTSRIKYDIIISEPPNMWVSGVSQLFTREFYKIVSNRLNEGGILCQWIPAFEMEEQDMELILHTINERFGYVSYWTNGNDAIILASHEMLLPDYGYIARVMGETETANEVHRGLPYADSAYIQRLLSKPNVKLVPEDRLTWTTALANTDNLPILEFKSAQNIFNKGHKAMRDL